MMAANESAVWHIQMFYGLKVQRGALHVDHFETRRAASLLAYLAFYPHRTHPREELAEMLWPNEDIDATRLRLRQVLNTIRRALASPDGTKDSLLLSDRSFVRVNAELLTTDVREFEMLCKAASQTEDPHRRIDKLRQAAELYQGDLLPGYYEDWAEQERRRLQDAHRETLLLLASSQAESGNPQSGLEVVRKLLAKDALDEEANQVYIRLCAQVGRPAEALRQYQTLEQGLWKELRALPSPELQSLIVHIRSAKAASAPVLTASLSAEASPPVPARSLTALPQSEPAEPDPTEDVAMQGEATTTLSASPMGLALTSFFGRRQEIHDLSLLLRPQETASRGEGANVARQPESSPRLVTLVGPGGSGKTRLAQEAARELQPAYAQRAWFISLADTQEGGRIPEKIAEAIYPNYAPTERTMERVVEALNRQPALLVLDNFEQLTGTGTAAVRELLEHAPALRCLVTSRQTLNLAGERRFDVRPLPVPEPVEDRAQEGYAEDGRERIAQSPSVQLFADRARNILPDFAITPENAANIARICRYLEGVPLALELAAAWVQVLDPAELLQRLQDRFTLLVNQQESAPSRHRSLYTAIEWSYEQLPPPVQRLFVRLSVFRNGWTLDAVETIGEEPQTLAYLTQLLRHSLILREGAGAGGRFRMLETLRDFARSRLEATELEVLRQRHAEYYLQMVECASGRLTGVEQAHWLERLQEENDNLRAALDWCVEAASRSIERSAKPACDNHSDSGRIKENRPISNRQSSIVNPQSVLPTEMGLRFVAAIWRFWEVRCHYTEAEGWIEQILVLGAQAEPLLRARALEGAGNLALSERAYARAQMRLEESVRLQEEQGETRGLASALSVLAATLRDQGDLNAAKVLFEKSLGIMREHKDTFGIARALGGLGVIAAWENDAERAHSLLEQSAAMYRICGHRKGMAWCYYERGGVARRQGDSTLRLTMFQEGLPISRALQDGEGIGFACFNIGAVYQQREAYAQAEDIGREALHAAQGSGLIGREVGNLLWLGDLAVEQANQDAGERYYKAALTRSVASQFQPGIIIALERLAYFALLWQDNLERAVCLTSAAANLSPYEPLEVPNAPRFLSPETRQNLQQVSDSPEWAHIRMRGQMLSLEQACTFALGNASL